MIEGGLLVVCTIKLKNSLGVRFREHSSIIMRSVAYKPGRYHQSRTDHTVFVAFG